MSKNNDNGKKDVNKPKSNKRKSNKLKKKEKSLLVDDNVIIPKVSRKAFKKLDVQDIEFIAMTYNDEIMSHDEKMDILTSKYGVKGRTIRDWWVKLGLSNPPNKLPPQLQKALFRSIDEDTDILLVTSAQNTTSINHNQWIGMNKYVDFLKKKYNLKAQIIVIPLRYRNPTSPTEDISIRNKRKQWWVDEVDENLYYNRIEFGDCVVDASAHIKPTKQNPLNGLDSIAGDNHFIVGSPRIHFKTIPRFRNDELRCMATTGSLTVKNYSKSMAGDNGAFNHSYGFTIIEKKKDGKCYPPRNIFVENSGEFIDLVHHYKNGKFKNNKKALALVMGDIHRKLLKKEVYEKTKEICKKIFPDRIVTHDVLDGYAFNPHEKEDTYVLRRKIVNGDNNVKEEVIQAVNFPQELLDAKMCNKVDVIESNHDAFLDRYIMKGKWKNDLHNSPAYLEYALIQQTVDLTEHGCIFGYLINKKYEDNDNVNYIQYGGRLRVMGVDLSLHGDAGSNGARGNVQTLKKLNRKTFTAHTHSPSIQDGNLCVGLSAEINQYYTRRGLSSHAHAHGLLLPNGKRQLLVFGDDFEVSYFL